MAECPAALIVAEDYDTFLIAEQKTGGDDWIFIGAEHGSTREKIAGRSPVFPDIAGASVLDGCGA